jgi:hypothetical protein
MANQNPEDDFVVGPPSEIPDCLERLAARGVKAKLSRLPVHREGDKTCGAPQVVSYESGPAGLRWSSPPQVTCLVALALSRFEEIAKEEAQRQLGATIKRIVHLGTYSCRPMVRFNLASEHSYANAIDIQGFELEGGKRVQILSHWGNKAEPPSTPEARFLRTIARRTFDESVFSVVLGPPWDALHKDHLHLDQARYRVDGLIVR